MPGSIPNAAMHLTTSKPSTSMDDGARTSPSRSLEGVSLAALGSSPAPRRSNKVVYVDLRYLTDEEKGRYATDLGERPLTYDEAFPEREMQGIIGELVLDAELHYFVKLSDGQAFKFAADDFALNHPTLVKQYKEKKSNGELEPFDPEATYLHPQARMERRLDSELRSALPSRSATEDIDEFAMDFEHSESDKDEDEGDDYDDASDTPVSVRKTKKSRGGGKQSTLPFSPKKTRSTQLPNHSAVLNDSDASVSSRSPSLQLRRSRRAKKATQDYDSDAYTQSPRVVKVKKKATRGPTSRPAYGHFRPALDLDYDSDEETAPLRAHRSDCAKCGGNPAHLQAEDLRKKKPKKRRAQREDEFEVSEDDNERVAKLGGWVRCLRCPIAAHWGCLAKTQRAEILRAALEKDKIEWLSSKPEDDDEDALQTWNSREPKKRPGLEIHQTTEFICGSCMKGGVCYCCKEIALDVDGILKPLQGPEPAAQTTVDSDVEMVDAIPASDLPQADAPKDVEIPGELLFRCSLCRRVAHYAHLPRPPDNSDAEYAPKDLADYYQRNTSWQCSDCASFVYLVDQILAWRPSPENAVEPKQPLGEAPNYKVPLPREYLVKWLDRSYLRVQWVPHMWLVATTPAKLSNFLKSGPLVHLLPEPVPETTDELTVLDEPVSTFGVGDEEEEDAESSKKPPVETGGTPDALIDAERRIPPAFKVIDRVLDIFLWRPEKRLNLRKKAQPQRRSKRARVQSESDDDDAELTLAQVEVEQELSACYDLGEQPSTDLIETVADWEKRSGKKFSISNIDLVVWGLFKWTGLNYDNVTWESPPRRESPRFAAFEAAMQRFIKARGVQVSLLSAKEVQAFEKLPTDMFRRKYAFKEESQPQLGQSDQFKLMPFQVDGVNWLCNNWWNRQHCILADEMGLGKTVQIVTFVGQIVKGFVDAYSACPVLVVVPNSTITNWVREFERWAPNLVVVPFHGEAKSREVIKNYELFHEHTAKGKTGLKYHVLVTTYDTLTSAKDSAAVFKRTPRWECLVVDEGQRLKGDSSILFKKLKELNTVHRIILTGTPLNNNIRELFNLMHFLDPTEWNDLKALASEYEDLTEEKIKQLHNMLRPYFLRRIKSEVLQLPPKNEVIVPVSMSPLQKEIYRSLLSQNLDLLQSLALSAAGTTINTALRKSNLNNLLMQLRKCLQHPYIVSTDIEPRGLSPQETHEKLVSASAKLVMLQMLLPKLKARGHRVLLFSQFKIALDVIEDYLRGEGFRYLRLDGDTKQTNRQKDMDEFNKPDSDIFIYILSTRAGGVGINLWSADTVIIHDPDFNPHQDLQAIARAHRYGQTKTCLVFKLMVKDSAEERMMQNSKKKLVLDHLIVQKMDDDTGEDMQSILTFGAQTLFQEGGDQPDRDVHYSETDIDKLIEKTETEGETGKSDSNDGAAFTFAKIWSADKDKLEEMKDSPSELQVQEDAWAQTLARVAEERAKARAQEATGRGVRRRVAPTSLKVVGGEEANTPAKRKKAKGKAKATPVSDDDAFVASEIESAGSTDGSVVADPLETDLAALKEPRKKAKRSLVTFDSPPSPEPIILYPSLPSVTVEALQPCGLCGLVHAGGRCFMTESSEHLAEYRGILINHAGDESLEDRRAAIAVIDETLHKRGHMRLVYGQPLHIVIEPTKVRPQPAQALAAPAEAPRVNGNAAPGSHEAAYNKLSNGIATDRAPPSSSHEADVRRPPPIPRLVGANSAVPGSSKRTLSPPPLATVAKKPKHDYGPVCAVCGKRPGHKMKHCAIAAQGAYNIQKSIVALQNDPAHSTIVEELRQQLSRIA